MIRSAWTSVVASFLTLAVAGCAATPPSRHEPTARPQVKQRGAAIIVIADGKTHYFENLLPHCVAYSLTGEWDFAFQEAALRMDRPDRPPRFVGVLLRTAASLPGSPEVDAVSRAVADLRASEERDYGQPISSRVVPFPATRPGAVLLEFEGFTLAPEVAARIAAQTLGPRRSPPVGGKARLPLRVLLPYLPGFVTTVTVWDEADAREVLDTLETTNDRQCWASTLRQRFPQIRWKAPTDR